MLNKKAMLICLTIITCAIFISAYTTEIDNTLFSNRETENKLIIDNLGTSNYDKQESAIKKNTIQVALLLDTSNSMDGLIEQAKSQLWNILNTMTEIEKENEDDLTLEVALYEYGNPRCTEANFISRLSAFTSDVDEISEKLFALSTEGGEEYCGSVIKNSIESLEWTNDDQLKMIYIAGNESFSQGPIAYNETCRNANKKDIYVNTIFCGEKSIGEELEWGAAAALAKGEYFNLDQNKKTEYISTPFDKEIARLNADLNNTYIPYGKEGNIKKQNLEKQDLNASKYGMTNSANRSVYKSSKKYKVESWDLVDAYKKDKKVIERKDLLSAEQNAMTIEELERQIETASSERDQIKDQIQKLNKQRKEFIKNHRSLPNSNSLEAHIKSAIKKQAEAKGYTLKV